MTTGYRFISGQWRRRQDKQLRQWVDIGVEEPETDETWRAYMHACADREVGEPEAGEALEDPEMAAFEEDAELGLVWSPPYDRCQ